MSCILSSPSSWSLGLLGQYQRRFCKSAEFTTGQSVSGKGNHACIGEPLLIEVHDCRFGRAILNEQRRGFIRAECLGLRDQLVAGPGQAG
jgi:hypothetical protein